MVRDVETIVSFASRHVTLKPGDLIYTGATGITSEIEPGDVVEVDIEGVGVLRNRVVAEE
jgi:2-keto-4-pentenoate hydratase/2-oxohepta-3-ene-1,7-dioic acid hydratase in catechol pathway